MRKILISLLMLPLCLTAVEDAWESTELIWNFGLAHACHIGPMTHPKASFRKEPVFDPQTYANLQSGDLVWVQALFVAEFYTQVLPHMHVPFVLMVSDGDHTFPADCLSPDQLQGLLNHECLIHLFAQNCDYQGSSSKISPIPIGIDFHTVAYKNDLGGWGMVGSAKEEEAKLLQHLKEAPPTSKRILRAFIDFQHSDSMHASFNRYLQFGEDRAMIFKRLCLSGVVDEGNWMNRNELWKIKRNYAFSISPHGNGLDCHRTWEDLALGCIVIVKTSPLDSLYEGLPVIIIHDWDEIHEANFKKWIVEYGDFSTNETYREKLTHRYWMEKIKKAAQPYVIQTD